MSRRHAATWFVLGVAGAGLVDGKLDAAQTERGAQRLLLEKLRNVTGAVASVVGFA
jgi:hypothetical protein